MDRGQRVAALLYHYVGPLTGEPCRGLTVTPDTFAGHIAALAAMGYNAILPAQWVAHSRHGDPLPKRAVIITFDDAFQALTEHAFPVLEKHGFAATVFVPTSLIGGTIACSPHAPESVLRIMSAAQISHWVSRGVHFGSHSRTHADLTALQPEAVSEELRGSRDDLSAITGQPVTTLAYPYGQSSAQVRELAGEIYESAFTIEEGVNDSTTPLTALKRTMVQHDDSRVDVGLRARYGVSVLERVRTAARGGKRARRERA